MFNYYRFIGSRYETYREIIQQQAERDRLSLNIKNFRDIYEDGNLDRLNIVLKNDIILDIYLG